MIPTVIRVRPAVAAAAFALSAFGICAVADRVEARLRVTRAPHDIQVGDTVRYQADDLTYEVVDKIATTVLIRRGDAEGYAHVAEVTLTQ